MSKADRFRRLVGQNESAPPAGHKAEVLEAITGVSFSGDPSAKIGVSSNAGTSASTNTGASSSTNTGTSSSTNTGASSSTNTGASSSADTDVSADAGISPNVHNNAEATISSATQRPQEFLEQFVRNLSAKTLVIENGQVKRFRKRDLYTHTSYYLFHDLEERMNILLDQIGMERSTLTNAALGYFLDMWDRGKS